MVGVVVVVDDDVDDVDDVDDSEEPVLPVAPVSPAELLEPVPPVVVVVDPELPEGVVGVAPEDLVEVDPAVEREAEPPAPGCSRATATPITTVAPVAASRAPWVRVRSRYRARCRLLASCGVLRSSRGDIRWLPLWGRRHLTIAGSTCTQGQLWLSCDLDSPGLT